METLLHLPYSAGTLLLIFFFQAAALLLSIRILRRQARTQRDTLLNSLSDLHTFSNDLEERSDPRQMANAALAAALKAVGAAGGCILLQGEVVQGLRHIGARGLSVRTVELLSAEPLLSFLATSTERWGSLLVISDLRNMKVAAEWQRVPLFREFVEAMEAEGLRALLIIGLAARGKTCGILFAGRRKPQAFVPVELRLAVAVGNQVGVALENLLLNQAAERHDKELKTLEQVSRAMRETFDLKEQVEILRANTKDLLGGSDMSLSLQDSPEGPLETVVPFRHSVVPESAAVMPASQLEQEVARARAPRLIVEGWQWAKCPVDIVPRTPRMGTWCGVPFHFSDGTLGVLVTANFQRERAITEEQFELIQVLANEAAGAFENARAFQREQRRASHLALLNEISRKATSVLNPKELLTNTCSEVRNAFGYDLTRIEIMNHHDNQLVVEAEAGYGEQLLGSRTPVGEGLSGSAAKSGEPVLANSVGCEPRYIALDPDVRSALSLPLQYQDELLGVLSLESRRDHAFASQDVLTLRTLADHLSIALHNARAYQNALEESITDGLTGLKTHRYFMEALEREWRHAQRSSHPFSVVMMDLDQFKPVNDRYGHLQGDRVLGTIAGLLIDQVRQSCVVARYGGDEFSVLMLDATAVQAQALAERLREGIEKDPFLTTHHVTASFGIGTFPEHGSTHEEILRVADAGMYLAKHENGNRVCIATPTLDSGLVEAYLGVEFKRKFPTGPEAFKKILNRIENAIDSDNDVRLVDTVTSLARAIDLSDHYTRNHSEAVSRLAIQLARQLRLSGEEVEQVRRAGILHDIGKIGIPDIILYKPDRLTAEEFDIMKSHSIKGQEILEPLKVGVIQRIGLMVRHHHEMFDGNGYPDKLKSGDIPLGARILTVADCFDTMVSERAYKKARSLDEALAELLRCSGTQFDPELVEAFLKSLESHGDPRNKPPLEAEPEILLGRLAGA